MPTPRPFLLRTLALVLVVGIAFVGCGADDTDVNPAPASATATPKDSRHRIESAAATPLVVDGVEAVWSGSYSFKLVLARSGRYVTPEPTTLEALCASKGMVWASIEPFSTRGGRDNAGTDTVAYLRCAPPAPGQPVPTVSSSD